MVKMHVYPQHHYTTRHPKYGENACVSTTPLHHTSPQIWGKCMCIHNTITPHVTPNMGKMHVYPQHHYTTRHPKYGENACVSTPLHHTSPQIWGKCMCIHNTITPHVTPNMGKMHVYPQHHYTTRHPKYGENACVSTTPLHLTSPQIWGKCMCVHNTITSHVTPNMVKMHVNPQHHYISRHPKYGENACESTTPLHHTSAQIYGENACESTTPLHHTSLQI